MKTDEKYNFVVFKTENEEENLKLQDILLKKGFRWQNKLMKNDFGSCLIAICIKNTKYHSFLKMYTIIFSMSCRGYDDLYDIKHYTNYVINFTVKYTEENVEKFFDCFSEDYKDFDREKFMKYFESEISAKEMGLI